MRFFLTSTVVLLYAIAANQSWPGAQRRRVGNAGSANALALASPNPQQLARGVLIEKIALKSDPAQSYTLYLPSAYTPEKKWPILYCFDPLARGGVPVELFRAAAEKYGWIVAGSNNSRNGPLRPSLDAAAALWDDTHARFSIDERRVHAAGFSGGARLAVRFGYLCRGCLAGVVACGAGFPSDIKPSAAVPFPVYAVAGIDDFNFPELKNLDDALDKFSVPHRLAVFAGAHAWPSADACADAIEWLELQAMKAGRQERDESFVEQLWQRQSRKARDQEAAREFYEAFEIYRSLAMDFRGLRDTQEHERKAAQLKETKEVRKALDAERAQINKQQRLAGELVALAGMRQDAEQGVVAAINFRKAVADLRADARKSVDTSERRIARRALNQVFAQFYEGATNLLQRRENYARAVSSLALAAEIASDNPRVRYELACAYALKRDKRKALDTLRKAIELGFKDRADVASNEALDSLRQEAEFRELVESITQER
jgi:dienelactone hydrolase